MNKQQLMVYKIKIIILGDSGVGKTNIVSRFTRQQFNIESKSTIGIQFAIRQVQAIVHGKLSKLIIQFWDTAGQQKYRSLMNTYFKHALGAIIYLRAFIELVQPDNRKLQLIYLYHDWNKSDLELLRQIKFQQQGHRWADKHHAIFGETSTLANTNIDEAMLCLIQQIVQKLNNQDISRYSVSYRQSQLQQGNINQHSSCC